jgi:hypothetical protein
MLSDVREKYEVNTVMKAVHNIEIGVCSNLDDSGLDEIPVINLADLTFCPPTPGFSNKPADLCANSTYFTESHSATQSISEENQKKYFNRQKFKKDIKILFELNDPEKQARFLEEMSNRWYILNRPVSQSNPGRDALFKNIISKLPTAMNNHGSVGNSVDTAEFLQVLIILLAIYTPDLYSNSDWKSPFNYSDMVRIYYKLESILGQDAQANLNLFSEVIEVENTTEYAAVSMSEDHGHIVTILDELQYILMQQ